MTPARWVMLVALVAGIAADQEMRPVYGGTAMVIDMLGGMMQSRDEKIDPRAEALAFAAEVLTNDDGDTGSPYAVALDRFISACERIRESRVIDTAKADKLKRRLYNVSMVITVPVLAEDGSDALEEADNALSADGMAALQWDWTMLSAELATHVPEGWGEDATPYTVGPNVSTPLAKLVEKQTKAKR